MSIVPMCTLASGQKVRLGRIRPSLIVQTDKYMLREYPDGSHKLTLKFGHYYDAAKDKVQPVLATDWRDKAMPSLKHMYLNDQLGCCVIASAYHQVGLWTGNDTPTCAVGTDAEVLATYRIWNPGNQDNGCVITQVLDYQKSHGISLNGVIHKIDDYVSVDWTNKLLMQVAIEEFGTVKLGINLPQAWEQAPDGGVWDVTNTPVVGGHDVPCFTGDTKVPLLDGTERTFKELADDVTMPAFWVYSCDSEGNVVPGLAHSARMTRSQADLVKVTLDNGETIRCTHDHRFMLRDGAYCEAARLQSGDSLMPLYRKLGVKQMKGYEQVYNPATKKWRYTHRVSAAFAHGGRYKGEVVHHADFDKRNNAPENLEIMSWEAHTALHAAQTDLLTEYAQSEEGRTKSREVINRLWADPEWRAKMVKQLGENGRAACNRRAAEGQCGTQTWTEKKRRAAAEKMGETNRGCKRSLAHRRATSAGLRKLYATDPEARQRLMERQAKAAAGASRQQRAGITEAQRQVRRESIKKAHAAKMARLATPNNHKVVSVELDGREDVYDMTVEEHHNFALSAGVFVHNCIDYDNNGVWIATWGGTRQITWRAMASRTWVEEADLPLSPDWYGSDSLAPNGIASAQLRADLAKLGGGVIPDPGPTPVPPTPVPPVPVPPTPTPPSPQDAITLKNPVRAGQYVRFLSAKNAGVYIRQVSANDAVEAE